MWELRLSVEHIVLPYLFMTWENTILAEASCAFTHVG